MRDGYRVLDADRHVIEPTEMWKSYLAPEFRSRAPYFEEPSSREPVGDRLARLGAKGLLPLTPLLMLGGEPVMHKLSERARIELAVARNQRAGRDPGGHRPESQLQHMGRVGIDVGFLFPTYTHYLVNIDGMDPALAAAFASAYNTWLHEYCARAPDRLFGVGAGIE